MKKKKAVTKLGRPPIPYDPVRHPMWVRGLASRGATEPEMCAAIGISHGTMQSWRKKYPDFLAALQVGKNETVARLYNSINKRAEGFSIDLTEKKIVEMPDGSVRKEITVKTSYFPPDMTATKLGLTNLDPAFRTERTAMELTGQDGAPLAVEKTIIILPDNGRGPAPKVIPAEVKEIKGE